MKRFALLIFCAGMFLAGASSTFAQNDKKPEFFGGYSFENVDSGISSTDLGTTTTLDNRFNANGINLAVTGYLTHRLGITGDFSGHWKSRADVIGTNTAQSKFALYNITGGPQFRFTSTSRVTPFVHALAGIARRNLTETVVGTPFTDDKTSFALNLGGGVDYRLNKRLAWRLFQLDYNPIFLQQRTVNSINVPSQTLNGFRFSTGIVIK
jgi:opacity protein-like surface antigen